MEQVLTVKSGSVFQEEWEPQGTHVTYKQRVGNSGDLLFFFFVGEAYPGDLGTAKVAL